MLEVCESTEVLNSPCCWTLIYVELKGEGGGGVEHVTLMACDIGGNTTILDKNLGTLWKILLPFAILLYPRNFAITPQHYRGKGACIGVSRIFGEDSRTNSLKQCPISNGRCCSRIKMLFTV